MRAQSAVAYDMARETLMGLIGNITDAAHLRTIGNQLFAVVDMVASSKKLASVLTSTTYTRPSKQGLVEKLFGDIYDPAVVETLKVMTTHIWSKPEDIEEACIELGFIAVVFAARADGELEKTQSDLFKVDQILRENRELRNALIWRSRTPDERVALMHKVFYGEISPVALLLLERAVRRTTSGRIISFIHSLRTMCAKAQGKQLAVVRVAKPLSDAQIQRIADILERRNGKPVAVDVVVDPEVIGGISIRTGAELYEGTLSSSLLQVRTRLAG